MDQITTLLLGGLIGFLASLLTSWVNYCLQLVEKKRERITKLREYRFDNIETTINEIFKWMDAIDPASSLDKKTGILTDVKPDEISGKFTSIYINTEIIGDKALSNLSTEFNASLTLFLAMNSINKREYLGIPKPTLENQVDLILKIKRLGIDITKRLDILKKQL